MLEGYSEISGVHLQGICPGSCRFCNQGLHCVSFTNIRWCKSVPSHCLIKCCCIYGLMQERHNSIASPLELRLSCTNPSILGKNTRSYKRKKMCDQNTFAICMVWLKLMHLHKYFDLVSVFIGSLNSSQLTIIFASGSDIDFVPRRQAIT